MNEFLLGQPCTLSLQTGNEMDSVISQLFKQCTHYLYIRSERLESDFFASEEFASSTQRLLTGDIRNKIHFLVDDPSYVVSRQRRVINLARSFSSYVKIHELPEEYKISKGFFIVADGIGYLQQVPERVYPAKAESSAIGYARKLERDFKHEWDRSTGLRTLFTTGLSG